MTLVVAHSRWIFLDERGDGHEVVQATFSNRGEPVDVSSSDAIFTFTDAVTTVLAGWGPTGAVEARSAPGPGSQLTVSVDMGASIAAGSSATFGVLVRRKGLAVASGSELSLIERNWHEDFHQLVPESVRSETVVVLPRSGRRRRVTGPTADCVSSRVVRWHGGLERDVSPPAHVTASLGRVRALVGLFDDLLADAYSVAAAAMTTAWPSRAEAARIAYARDQLPSSVVGEFEDLLAAPKNPAERLEALWLLREGLALGGVPDLDDAVAVSDGTILRLEGLHREASIAGPLPHTMDDAIDAILSFAAHCIGGATAWDSSATEAQLHREIQQWLAARQGPPIREAEVGNGRMDLLVGDVPLELKADRFGGTLEALVRRHAQQAADYAVRTGKGAALLVGLDTSAPVSTLHGPHLRERVVVERVASSLASGSGTLVVAVLIPAFQCQPSKLRMPAAPSP